jgi:AraC-like DNA-binding protein
LADHVGRVWFRGGLLPPALPYPAVDLLVFPDGTVWVAGPEISARQGCLPSGGLTGVRLRPGSCRVLLGLAADEIPLEGVPLAEILSREPGTGLEGAFQALRRAEHAPDQDVLTVIKAMHCAPGDPVSGHAAAVGMSERQLRRRFAVAVGLGPKAYARVVRLHRAVGLARQSISHGVEPRWAEIALRSGFYDQPHLLAEFRRSVGCPPGALVRPFSPSRAG